MCIIFLYFCDNPTPDGYRLIIASNRDEFYSRPTAFAKFWSKNPSVIADAIASRTQSFYSLVVESSTHKNVITNGQRGMDLEAGREGGTWLGMTKDGKFAAITNYRQAPKFTDPNATGRGHLVPDFLEGDGNVRNYLENVSSNADRYNGFNLLVGTLSKGGDSKVGWYCNVEEKAVKMLSPGIHVLSNKVLNCSWPKMVYGRKRFADILGQVYTKQELIDKLIGLLTVRDRSFTCGDETSFIGPQDEGCNMNIVNACRAIFVNCKEIKYGTRTNTVVLVDAVGHVTYVERSMEDGATDPDKAEWRLATHEFDIQENNDCTGTELLLDTTAKENIRKKLVENITNSKAAARDDQEHFRKAAKKRPLTNGCSKSAMEPADKVTMQEKKE